MRKFIATKIIKNQYFLIILLVAWWITVAMALPLWLPFLRTFPCVPAFSFVPLVPSFFHVFFLFVQFIASLFIIFSVKYRRCAWFVFIFCFLFLVLTDINRLQPYFYFELLLLSICVFTLPQKNIMSMRIIFGACYFWAGIHKINQFFVPSIILLLQKTFLGESDFLVAILPFIPYIEIILGLAFLSIQQQTLKKIMYAFAILLHLSIILLLLSANWNKIVITWNLAMIFLLLGLYHVDTQSNVVASQNQKLSIICFVVAFCLPFVNLFGYVDNYLSWRLYSCQPSPMRWYASNKDSLLAYIPLNLLQNYKVLRYNRQKKQYYIDFEAWLLAETHTTIYAETRYIAPIINQLDIHSQIQK
jgi:hypothetical protein